MAVVTLIAAAFFLSSCYHIDNNRIHANVYVVFNGPGVWENYGVSGAGMYKEFILPEGKPADFPYTVMSATGLGGILLCTTYAAVPVAYDLSCPVECRADIRLFINDQNLAECPKCHSQYDVFEKTGYPMSGRAAKDGFGLQVYNVAHNSTAQTTIITR